MCEMLVKKSPLTINRMPWRMPKENTQKPALLPRRTRRELWEITRRNLDYVLPTKSECLWPCRATINYIWFTKEMTALSLKCNVEK